MESLTFSVLRAYSLYALDTGIVPLVSFYVTLGGISISIGVYTEYNPMRIPPRKGRLTSAHEIICTRARFSVLFHRRSPLILSIRSIFFFSKKKEEKE